MAVDDFFRQDQKEQSAIKVAIVYKYFDAWSNVIKNVVKKRGGNLAYVDLFSGPGFYEDLITGARTDSTPLVILKRAVSDPILRERLVSWFNDINADHADKLSSAISNIPGIHDMRHAPIVNNIKVTDEVQNQLRGILHVPALYFIDPYGYIGVSAEFINTALETPMSECIFFFNFSRINRGLPVQNLRQTLNRVFGTDRAHTLRRELLGLGTTQRRERIISAIKDAVNPNGRRYVQEFSFKGKYGNSMHDLIFVTKNELGLRIMKDIMAGLSTSSVQGVPSLEFNPMAKRQQSSGQQSLFEFDTPIDDLADELCRVFSGRSVTFHQMVVNHHPGTNYLPRNYRDAVRQLEIAGRISTQPGPSERRMRSGVPTVPNSVIITFL